ncbi:MAG: radical SAM protein [Hyphomicrobiaceae bacterium]
MARAKRRMIETGQWHGAQSMGRRWPIGCVALEVTQRCNLDCTLCYLSEAAEAIKDIPLAELFRRIDTIFDMYGPNTDVQVTGGDPTLRSLEDLVAIVRRIRERGMRPSLFTNGIRATRPLLETLAKAGLVDVAFHVDMTQERKGYSSEMGLNRLRREYIERARGLGFAVIFNTTIFSGNAHEIPMLAAFFLANSDVVSMASFQLAADTGRGRVQGRPRTVTPDSVAEAIRAGTSKRLSFDFPHAGHRKCNRYAMALVCNGRAYNAYDEPEATEPFLEATAHTPVDRQNRRRAVTALLLAVLRRPRLLPIGLRLVMSKAWQMRSDLVVARGRVTKISFFIHNFMDASCLERERIAACAFMVATADGPLSMCLHNARRDDFLLRPLPMQKRSGLVYWSPTTGGLQADPHPGPIPPLPTKRRKGRGVPRKPVHTGGRLRPSS